MGEIIELYHCSHEDSLTKIDPNYFAMGFEYGGLFFSISPNTSYGDNVYKLCIDKDKILDVYRVPDVDTIDKFLKMKFGQEFNDREYHLIYNVLTADHHPESPFPTMNLKVDYSKEDEQFLCNLYGISDSIELPMYEQKIRGELAAFAGYLGAGIYDETGENYLITAELPLEKYVEEDD